LERNHSYLWGLIRLGPFLSIPLNSLGWKMVAAAVAAYKPVPDICISTVHTKGLVSVWTLMVVWRHRAQKADPDQGTYHWLYYCKADLFWYMMWIIHQLRVWDRMQVWFAESDDRASGLGLSDPSLRRLPFALVDWLGSLFSVLPAGEGDRDVTHVQTVDMFPPPRQLGSILE
jgi:hypothetical protein